MARVGSYYGVRRVFGFNFRGRPLTLPEKLSEPCNILHFALDRCINTYMYIVHQEISALFSGECSLDLFICIDVSEQKYIRI